MPKASATNVIKSVRKLIVRKLTLLLGVFFAVILIALIITNHGGNDLKFGSQSLQIERVDTPALREKGLSGRSNLPAGQGMLFVFSDPSQYCFWMKDMKFNIDMIWLDSAGQVIKVQSNVSPSTYPASFCPDKDAQYVIEVNADIARQAGVKPGNKLNVH
jgi:uncharacterized membrane protein (UPF0127 family)